VSHREPKTDAEGVFLLSVPVYRTVGRDTSISNLEQDIGCVEWRQSSCFRSVSQDMYQMLPSHFRFRAMTLDVNIDSKMWYTDSVAKCTTNSQLHVPEVGDLDIHLRETSTLNWIPN
jgi:hypothetical protein